jgi:predicted ester cyclase
MTAEENKKITKRFLEEVFNANNTSAIDNYISNDYVDHSPPPGVPGNKEGFKMIGAMVHQAFPDFKYTITNLIAENDMIVAHLTSTGTMKGAFMEMPATGKHATWTEIHIGKMKDGKFVEHWTVIDQLSMLQQLGLVPSPQRG